MTPEFMGEVILKMQESYLAKSTGEPDIEVLLTKNDLEKVEKLMKGAMFDSLKKRPEFSMGHDFGAGLKIGFKGDDLFFDFSDEVIAELICAYVGPKLATIIKQES
jgi:vacuolar-type H+-ATPase subunit E/Vma4